MLSSICCSVIMGHDVVRIGIASALASFPGPCAAFGCTKERDGPGMFPHVRDIKGRKVVERT